MSQAEDLAFAQQMLAAAKTAYAEWFTGGRIDSYSQGGDSFQMSQGEKLKGEIKEWRAEVTRLGRAALCSRTDLRQ